MVAVIPLRPNIIHHGSEAKLLDPQKKGVIFLVQREPHDQLCPAQGRSSGVNFAQHPVPNDARDGTIEKEVIMVLGFKPTKKASGRGIDVVELILSPQPLSEC